MKTAVITASSISHDSSRRATPYMPGALTGFKRLLREAYRALQVGQIFAFRRRPAADAMPAKSTPCREAR